MKDKKNREQIDKDLLEVRHHSDEDLAPTDDEPIPDPDDSKRTKEVYFACFCDFGVNLNFE